MIMKIQEFTVNLVRKKITATFLMFNGFCGFVFERIRSFEVVKITENNYQNRLTLSCLPIYPMPSLKVFYQNMDYYNELNIYQKVLNEFRPNFAETW